MITAALWVMLIALGALNLMRHSPKAHRLLSAAMVIVVLGLIVQLYHRR